MARDFALNGLSILVFALLACRANGRCKSNSDCQANTYCQAGRCVAPAPVVSVAPKPPAPKTVSVGGLELGRHACVMQDGTGAYNRICTVSARADGTLHVNAPGAALNPDIKFHLDATGGPDRYDVNGKMTAFDSCTGSYSATLARESVGGSEWFVARFKHCKIMMRVEML
jgi:hypothetical protein